MMQENIRLYIPLVYILAGISYAWLGIYAWRKRPAVAVIPFAWTMLGLSIWSFAYGLEVFSHDLGTKLFFVKIEYLGIVTVPVFIFKFALEYTGKRHLLTRRNRAMLWIFPALILLLVWLNEILHAMWNQETVVESYGLNLLSMHPLFFFWAMMVFSYILFITSGLLLIMEFIQSPGIYRLQASLVIMGIIFPWLGNLIFITNTNPIPNLDVTPLFFIPTGLGLSWAITRYRLLDVLPLEHLTLLQNMKDGVIVVSPQRRVLYLNPIAESLFDHKGTNTIGQPINHVFGKYGEALASHLTGVEHRAEVMFGEGEQARVFEVTVSSVSLASVWQESSKPDSMITLHDITEHKDAEIALTRRETIMSAISLAAEQFLKETMWEQKVTGVLEKIGQAINTSRVYVCMNYVDEKNILYSSLCYEWAAPGIQPQINNPGLQHVPLQQAGFGRWEKELARGEYIAGLVREFPQSEHGILKAQGSLSVAVMPVFVENLWWGFIMFDECKYERQWTDIELKALHTTANIFGSAESRSRAEQKLLKRQSALTLLQDIVRDALQAENLKDMAENLVGRMAKLISANGCFITLWNENNKQTTPLAAYGPYHDTYSSMHPVPGSRTFTESVLDIGHTLIVDDAYKSPYIDIRIAQQFPSRSVIVLPLIAGKNKLGAIIISFDKYHHFQPEEVAICEQASSLIALAFEKFQAMEQVQIRAATSEKLRKAGTAITETLGTGETVARILEQLKQVIPYDSASVQVLNENELEIIGGSGWKNPEDVIGLRFPIPGNNPNSVVIESGKTYRLSEISEVYEAFGRPPHNHIRSWLGVPLITQDRIVGLLAIDSTEPNHFTEEHASVAIEFANQVAVALENTRIFEEAQTQAIIDPLTTLYNRRGLFRLGRIEFDKSINSSKKFAAIMIDIDHFKNVNDSYNHETGDKVLRELALYCKKGIRDIDIVGRYGGEEIIILLPDTDMRSSLMIAERLRNTIACKPIKISENLEVNVTASLGVACVDNNTTTLEVLINRADQAMYIAKHKGRNRVEHSI